MVESLSHLKQMMNIPPFIKRVEFFNLAKEDKKPVKVALTFDLETTDVQIAKVFNRLTVSQFRDPDTGLIISTKAGSDRHDVQMKFVKYTISVIKEFWQQKYNQLSNLKKQKPDVYETKYKSLEQLQSQMNSFLHDQSQIIRLIHQTLSDYTPADPAKQILNSELIFKDTELTQDMMNTVRVPYDDPNHIKPTKQQLQLVGQFLNVFFDTDNAWRFAWYMGAVLNNVAIYDDRVSKMMVMIANKGGCGKSTLITGMCNALFTKPYISFLNSFDKTFDKSDRFSDSDITGVRIAIFDEADWQSMNFNDHDFKGLSTGAIRSFFTSGQIRQEAKYQDASAVILKTLPIALTNYLPHIPSDSDGLKRRLFFVKLKPSSMNEKGKKLNLRSSKAFNDYLSQHAYDFAVVFSAYFRQNQYAYLNDEYDEDEMRASLSKDTTDMQDKQQHQVTDIRQLLNQDVIEGLEMIGQQYDLNMDKIIELLDNPSDVSNLKTNTDAVCFTDNKHIYFDSRKTFWQKYTGSSNARKIMQNIVGKPVVKLYKRMFRLN